MALPKLNLQFLTLHDYLLRSFQLFRLESAYEIRSVSQSVYRVLPAHAYAQTCSHGTDAIGEDVETLVTSAHNATCN